MRAYLFTVDLQDSFSHFTYVCRWFDLECTELRESLRTESDGARRHVVPAFVLLAAARLRACRATEQVLVFLAQKIQTFRFERLC